MDEYLINGLAAIVHPDTHFYNCNGCGWLGDELAYADENGRGKRLISSGWNRMPNHRPYKSYQGHCPQCGRPFAGTRAGVQTCEFVKLQQDIIDQELREMSAEDVDNVLSTMKAWEAFDFLERIGHLRAWLVYNALEKL